MVYYSVSYVILYYIILYYTILYYIPITFSAKISAVQLPGSCSGWETMVLVVGSEGQLPGTKCQQDVEFSINGDTPKWLIWGYHGLPLF